MNQFIKIQLLLFGVVSILTTSSCSEDDAGPGLKSTANTVTLFSPFRTWSQLSTVANDTDGNFYTFMAFGTYSTSGFNSFDVTAPSGESVVKIDNDGGLVWEAPNEVQKLNDADLFVDHSSNVYFGSVDGKVQKIKPDATVEIITFPNLTEVVQKVMVDRQENYYLLVGLTNNAKLNKYDKDLNLIWTQNTGFFKEMKLTDDENSIVVLSEINISRYNASDFTFQWSYPAGGAKNGSFFGIDAEENVYVTTIGNKPYPVEGIVSTLDFVIVTKLSKFGEALFTFNIENDSDSFYPRGINVREDHFYLGVSQAGVVTSRTPIPSVFEGYIGKYSTADGGLVWQQYPYIEGSINSGCSVSFLAEGKSGNLWTGFSFFLTQSIVGGIERNISFGDFTHAENYGQGGGTSSNIASLKP